MNEIAYIIKGYPRLSEIFIANEIYLLQQAGVPLRLYVIKKESEAKRHAVIDKITAPIHYLPPVTSLTATFFLRWLWQNMFAYLPAHRRLFRRRRLAYLRTLARALAYCFLHRTRRLSWPKKAYIKEFLQAGFIADNALSVGSVRHFHAHFCHGATTIALFAGELAGIPFSFTAHAKDIYQPKLNPGTLLQKKIHRARFVTTCTRTNREYLHQLSSNGTPIYAIYHGLDAKKFAPRDERDGTPTPLILSVGRFVEKKGYPYLLKACRLLVERGWAFRCVLIGEPGEQSGLVENLRRELRLETRVELHGPMTQSELIDWYQRSDIFALPCVVAGDGDRDGIPNVLAEAMAMGLPVVSTQISGIPELIENGVDGILVPQRDVYALAAALERLIRQNPLRKRFGQAARAKICRVFDATENTRKLASLYAQVLDGLPSGNTEPTRFDRERHQIVKVLDT